MQQSGIEGVGHTVVEQPWLPRLDRHATMAVFVTASAALRGLQWVHAKIELIPIQFFLEWDSFVGILISKQFRRDRVLKCNTPWYYWRNKFLIQISMKKKAKNFYILHVEEWFPNFVIQVMILMKEFNWCFKLSSM